MNERIKKDRKKYSEHIFFLDLWNLEINKCVLQCKYTVSDSQKQASKPFTASKQSTF